MIKQIGYLSLLLTFRQFTFAQVNRLIIEEVASRTIRLEGYPDWIEIDKSSAWISNGGLMQRVSSETHVVVAEVKINRPCAAFAIGFGSVWVASCGDKSIVRISLASNSVIASIPLAVADDEGSIVAAEHGVWVLSDVRGILTRIDPVTNTVVANIQVKPNSFAAMAGYGSIWITNSGDVSSNDKGSVQRIDPRTNKVVRTIQVSKQPRFLAVGEGGVWVFNQADGSVSRIDPKSNKVVVVIDCGVPGTGGDIAAGEGFVWVRAKKELLLVIDPHSNKVIATFGPPAGSGAVRAGNGYVWVSAHDVNKIWKLRAGVIPKLTVDK